MAVVASWYERRVREIAVPRRDRLRSGLLMLESTCETFLVTTTISRICSLASLRLGGTMAKGKKGLKASLSSQQSRLKKKKEAVQAAELADRKGKKPGAVIKRKTAAKPAYIPFTTTNRILLVGEGNFSFTAALVVDPPPALQYLPASNITATAYDSEEECYSKYPESQNIVSQLREKGVGVVFGVDATKLEKCGPLKGQKYDKIVWNFPHAGKTAFP